MVFSPAGGTGDVPLCGTEMLHRCGDTIPGPRQGPSIVPLPRNGLASSATGGASPISPIFFSRRKRKRAVHGPKEKCSCVQLCPRGTKLDGRESSESVPPIFCKSSAGCAILGTRVELLPRICRRGCRVGVVTARLSAASPAAAAPALQASGSEKERWSFQSLPDLATPIRVAEILKIQQDRARAQRRV